MPGSATIPSHTPLAALPAIVLDLETTGLDVKRDRMVQAAAIAMLGSQILDAPRINQIIDPGMPVPEASSRIHGLTDADRRGRAPLHRFRGNPAGNPRGTRRGRAPCGFRSRRPAQRGGTDGHCLGRPAHARHCHACRRARAGASRSRARDRGKASRRHDHGPAQRIRRQHGRRRSVRAPDPADARERYPHPGRGPVPRRAPRRSSPPASRARLVCAAEQGARAGAARPFESTAMYSSAACGS